MTAYPLPTFAGDQTTAFIYLLQYLNEQSFQLLGLLIILLVSLGVYNVARPERTREAVVGALFAGMVVAILLGALQIANAYLVSFLVISFIGAIVLLINR